MRILVTAGPTREYLDPVRYISNSSTGFFGYSIAAEAARRGHKTVLISGPTSLIPPEGVKFVPVVSALQMKKEVEKHLSSSDCIIMSAAVADYRPASFSAKKIKKNSEKLSVKLIRNPDILSQIGKKKGSRVIIGFALETGGLEKNASEKLNRKKIDILVGTETGRGNGPFGDNVIRVLIMTADGGKEKVFSGKKKLARIILDKAEAAKYPYTRNKI